ncbi:MAG TPA: hypothetical protein VLX09_10875 [Stellaceae bacterium]|nr:hypothetical protein [Stellaceae bacterium]
MSGSETRPEFAALWRQWQGARHGGDGAGPRAPEPLLLAAYAEHRLSEASAAGVEAWLAENSEGIEDLIAAHAVLDQPEAASAQVIERALSLVPASGINVVPFERPRPRVTGLRLALAWSGMAASIAATGLVGFVLGSDAYSSFTGTDQDSQISLSQQLFTPPTSILGDPGEEPNT